MMTDSKSDEPEDLIEPLPGNKSLSNLQKFTTTVEPSVCGHFRGKMKFLLENFPPLVLDILLKSNCISPIRFYYVSLQMILCSCEVVPTLICGKRLVTALKLSES